MSKKQKLGQFYTTNASYIVGNLLEIYPKNVCIVDPFAGNWDLLNIINDGYNVIEAFDIDPKNIFTIKQDTLKDKPDYNGKWIITNPPYLSKNKNKDKTIYEQYGTDDYYKASILSIIGCEGGIIIVPLNFLSAKDNKIRDKFLSKYQIEKLNVFEEQVFSDTSYTVCSFSFIKKDNDKQTLQTTFYPSKIEKKFDIEKNNGYIIGNNFYRKINNVKSEVKIERLVKKNKNDGYTTNIFLNAIDTGSTDGRIRLELRDKPFVGKISDRAFATIVSSKKLTKKQQKRLVERFNEILDLYREKYNSLFLTNFRNATKNYARKRIDFETAYKIIKYIIDDEKF